jgi:D-alanyl-D-alanine dipeptidase
MVERKTPTSEWKRVGESFSVVVGRSGLAWGDDDVKPLSAAKYKKEGDGNAPAGLFPLIASFGTAVKPEALESPYTKLDRSTECVDDERSNHYNKIVNRMQVGAFDWKSSEKMLEVGEQYSLGIVVGYNMYPVERGRGSCIFLHIWKAPGEPTAGCTAMERRNLERLFGWLVPAKTPYLIQLPASEYDHHRKAWKLPKIK